MNENEFSFRTDLVMEARDIARYDYEMEIPGVESETQKYDGLTVTRLVISSDDAEQRIGKLKGKYVTLESADLGTGTVKSTGKSVRYLPGIQDMIRIPTDATVLVVGQELECPPDALGPRVVHHLVVTGICSGCHHLKFTGD